MKKLAFAFLSLSIASTALAQSFSFGPRVSSYSTDYRGVTSLRTGRRTSFGLQGDYRSGSFVLDYFYDHDSTSDASVIDLLIDTGDYTRDRGEVTAGWSVLPVLDLQGGVRYETSRIGGVSIIGTPLFTDVDSTHQALVFGVKLHSDPHQRVGVYLLGRGYVGNMKINDLAVDDTTNGYRFEAGVSIPIGESNWAVVPAAEYEHFDMQDFGTRINTNRVMLAFVYRGGGR